MSDTIMMFILHGGGGGSYNGASVDCWISVRERRRVGTLSALCPSGCTSLDQYPEQEWLNRLTESAPSSVTA